MRYGRISPAWSGMALFASREYSTGFENPIQPTGLRQRQNKFSRRRTVLFSTSFCLFSQENYRTENYGPECARPGERLRLRMALELKSKIENKGSKRLLVF